MIFSLLLRGTLLLLVVNHSIAQEWYTQDNYGPEFYSPNMVQDTQPSFPEKRETATSANESKSVYLSDYAPNVRQKRDIDDADSSEQHSSDVTEYTTNDVTDHVDNMSEDNVQSIDPNSSLDMNDRSADNNSYEYARTDTNSDAGFYSNETTDRGLDGPEINRQNDVMDEREEPTNEPANESTNDYAETPETKSTSNEAMQEGSGTYSYHEDDSQIVNKVENDNRQGQESAAEADESDENNVVEKEQKEDKTTTTTKTTSTRKESSGSLPTRKEDDDDEWFQGDEDEDEDEQPVKRQNLGMKIM